MSPIPAGIVSSGRVAAAGSPYSTAILAHSPALYWRLGESSGTTAADASGNGRTGTYTAAITLGSTSLVTGDANTAVTMTGAGHRLTRAYDATFMTGDRTVECIFNATDVSGPEGHTVMSQANAASSGTGWHIEIYLGQMYLWVAGGYASGSVPVSVSTRYHVAYRLSGTTSSLLVNGVAMLSRSAAPSEAADFRVGTRLNSGSAFGPFLGATDEVSWIPSALSDAQILDHKTKAGI